MLSKKTQYAFQALMYLAEKETDEPVLIAEIARKKKIPLKFLENILLELKNANILESKKGKGSKSFSFHPSSDLIESWYGYARRMKRIIGQTFGFSYDGELYDY